MAWLGFWFCFDFFFLIRTPQGDTFMCFTYLSGKKNIKFNPVQKKAIVKNIIYSNLSSMESK